MRSLLGGHREAYASQRMRYLLLCYFMPFFYGAATRVPLVYIGVEARQIYGMPWWQVGLVIATYQLARAVINFLIPILGSLRSHAFGVGVGLLGYVLHGMNVYDVHYFVTSIFFIGFSEVIICMQNYIKLELTPFGTTTLREGLRMQYACNVAGTAIGFIGGAVLYHVEGHRGASVFGIFLQAAEISSLLYYQYLLNSVSVSQLTPEFISRWKVLGPLICCCDSAAASTPQEEEFIVSSTDTLLLKQVESGLCSSLLSSLASSQKSTRFQSPANSDSDIASPFKPGTPPSEERKALLDDEACDLEENSSNVDDPKTNAVAGGVPRPPWISYFIILTFAIQALMIGTILSTAPILLHEQYDLDFYSIGVVFGLGETFGAVLLLLLVPTAHLNAVQRYFKDPLNMLIVVGSLGFLALLFAINNVNVATGISLAILTLNDLGTSLSAEFIGATTSAPHYMHLNSLGNTLRRVGNTATAALGPILYGMRSYLPFTVFGLVTVVWVFVMAGAFAVRANQVICAREKKAAKGHVLLHRVEVCEKDRAHRGLFYFMKEQSFISAEVAMQGGSPAMKKALAGVSASQKQLLRQQNEQ